MANLQALPSAAPAAHGARAALLCLAGAALFMAVAGALYWPSPELAFRTDDSPVAWLSSAQMWALAILALRLGSEAALPRALSLWLAIAMMGMAFDEQFMLHEHWKYNCLAWLAACRYHWVTELPMLMVGLLGLATTVWLHQASPARTPRVLLWAAVLIGLGALVLRATGQPASVLPYKAALLVLAQALFTGFLLACPASSARAVQVHS